MSPPLRLEHIGETLVCKLLSELSKSDQLKEVRTWRPQEGEDQRALGSLLARKNRAPEWIPEAGPVTVALKEGVFSLDGRSRIDVLFKCESVLVPFEVKLGTTVSAIRENLSKKLTRSEHKNQSIQRLNGSMAAVFSRSFAKVCNKKDVRLQFGEQELSEEWVLVLRRFVYGRLKKDLYLPGCHVVVFEDLVEAFLNSKSRRDPEKSAAAEEFNLLVRKLLDFDYLSVWKLKPEPKPTADQ